jgi:hypothetical protein
MGQVTDNPKTAPKHLNYLQFVQITQRSHSYISIQQVMCRSLLPTTRCSLTARNFLRTLSYGSSSHCFDDLHES